MVPTVIAEIQALDYVTFEEFLEYTPKSLSVLYARINVQRTSSSLFRNQVERWYWSSLIG